jgi:hypothetical protein
LQEDAASGRLLARIADVFGLRTHG